MRNFVLRCSGKHSLPFILTCSVALLFTFGTYVSASEKPNVVYILADDLGIGDVSCYNPDSKISTPGMDQLAKEGMRFNDAHTPSSVCTPTRYSVLTGRYAWRTRLKNGVLWGYSPSLIEPGRLTIASMLKEHGYKTAGIGKWHLGLQTPNPEVKEAWNLGSRSAKQSKVDYTKPLRPGPVTVGFDTYFGIPGSLDMDPYVYIQDDHLVALPTEWTNGGRPRRSGGEGYWKSGKIAPGFHHDDVLPTLGEKAAAFIKSQKPDQPFFLYLPLNAPHQPWVPKKEKQGRTTVGYYGDFVLAVDDVVRQVTNALDEAGLAENTIVIMTSDNGANWNKGDINRWKHDSNMGLRGEKADIHEGGHRVPFIVRWPNHVRKASVSDELICLTDWTATMASIVGYDLPENAAEDSEDFLPVLLEKEGAKGRDTIVHHALDGMFAIRQGDWKLIEGLGSGGFTSPRRVEPKPGEPIGQLYNLADDPTEQVNLYQKHPEIVARLHDLLVKYKETGRSR